MGMMLKNLVHSDIESTTILCDKVIVANVKSKRTIELDAGVSIA